MKRITTLDAADEFDPSIAGINRFLKELVDLAGQTNDTYTVPMLELDFDGILTKTSLSTNTKDASLAIMVLLPQDKEAGYVLPLSGPEPGTLAAPPFAGVAKLLWHADEGRYVIMFQVPISGMTDEIGLFDAILDSMEYAKAWFKSLSA